MPKFRKATEEDIKHIAMLEADIFSDTWTVQGIRETFSQKQTFIIVAEDESMLAGYCIVYYVMDEAEIARIAVSPALRRQGVGRGLLDYTCKCCLEERIGRLLLDVRESNQGAVAFYRQYGFAEDGIRRNFYDNPQENAVLMSKTLV